MSELKRAQSAQRRARLAFGRGWRGAKTPAEDFIATREDGEGIRPDVFGNRFRTVCEQEKRDSVARHILRHSRVPQMIALGFDAVTISVMSGHSPDVLLRVYAHAFDAQKRKAMDTLGEARKAARAAN